MSLKFKKIIINPDKQSDAYLMDQSPIDTYPIIDEILGARLDSFRTELHKIKTEEAVLLSKVFDETPNKDLIQESIKKAKAIASSDFSPHSDNILVTIICFNDKTFPMSKLLEKIENNLDTLSHSLKRKREELSASSEPNKKARLEERNEKKEEKSNSQKAQTDFFAQATANRTEFEQLEPSTPTTAGIDATLEESFSPLRTAKIFGSH